MKTLIILCLLLSANMASASWVSEKVKMAETWVDRHVLKQGVEQAAIPALAQVAVPTSGIAKTIMTIEQTVTEVRTPLLTLRLAAGGPAAQRRCAQPGEHSQAACPRDGAGRPSGARSHQGRA